MAAEGDVEVSGIKRMGSFIGEKRTTREDEGINHTTIICTIGPKTMSKEMVGKLSQAGMSIARLNFSHGTHEYHQSVIDNVRGYVKEQRLKDANKSKLCAIMLDTKGPEIRTGKVKDNTPVQLVAGSPFRWHSDESLKEAGDATQMYCTYKDLWQTVKVGGSILCADALLSFTVQSIQGQDVLCTVDNSGMLSNTKNMNLPNCITNLPAMTDKDKSDITFGVENDIDIIAASFIRKAADVEEIRNFAGVREKGIAIVSKIENQEGIDNFDAILAVSDGIMVARGDMGSEIPLENVCTVQKMICRKCNEAGKPVIVATQMLESMISNPRPTRAEAGDVANAIYDGADCVMLSGETANGDWPVEAVLMMRRICCAAEAVVDPREQYRKLREQVVPVISIAESITSSAVKSAWDLQASLIVVVTETGHTARLVSKYRPRQPILTLTPKLKTAHTLMLSRSCIPYLTMSTSGTDSLVTRALKRAKAIGLCKPGDYVIVIFGKLEGVSGSVNSMKITKIEA